LERGIKGVRYIKSFPHWQELYDGIDWNGKIEVE
jgi:hypothetical protein